MNRAAVIRDALAEAEQALTRVEAQIKSLVHEREVLRNEVDGLRLALSAREKADMPSLFERVKDGALKGALAVGEAQVIATEWRGLARTEAIERIFAEEGKPIHRADLQKLLRLKGRNDGLNDISAALAYLRRIGKAEKLGGGRWLVRSGSPQPEADTTAADAAEGSGA